MDLSEINIQPFLAAREKVRKSQPGHTDIIAMTATHFKLYLRNLSDFSGYNLQRTVPIFIAESQYSFFEIWQTHQSFVEGVLHKKYDEQVRLIYEFMMLTPFFSYLIVMGQRITPGSYTCGKALPPEESILKTAVFKPFNSEIAVGVRAWEKHVGRTPSNFWGKIRGKPKEREMKVREKVNQLFEQKTWWNTFEHYKHGRLHEIREKNGHGLRWKLDPLTFIGFVEPFTTHYE